MPAARRGGERHRIAEGGKRSSGKSVFTARGPPGSVVTHLTEDRNVPKVGVGAAEPSPPGGAEWRPGASASRGPGLRSALHLNGRGGSPGVGGTEPPERHLKARTRPKPGGRDADTARR